MAKLGIGRIADFVPGTVSLVPATLTDGITVAKYDAGQRELTVSIKRGEAVVIAAYSPTLALDSLAVSVLPSVDAIIIARVNRLLDGLAAPRLERYHRTGQNVWRTTGTPTPLPASLVIARGANGFQSTVSRLNAPTTPVVTPTPPAIAPVPPVSVPPVQAQVTPELQSAPVAPPVVTPVVPFKVAPKAEDAPKGSTLFSFPSRKHTDVIKTSPLSRKVLQASWDKHVKGERSTIALVGPAGTGKTSLVWDLAAEKGVGLFVFDAAGAASFADWTGTTALVTGEAGTITRFVPSSFIEAIRADGEDGDTPRIVLVDEVNRAETGGALNALLPILSAAQLYIPETGKVVPISRNVFFAFTLNRGSAYAGTVTLDAALADRMQAWVLLDYLPEADEVALIHERTGVEPERGLPLVKAARQIRDIAARGEVTTGVSTRRVLEAARLLQHGLTAAEAAEHCWANAYADEGGAEGERGIVLVAIKSVLV